MQKHHSPIIPNEIHLTQVEVVQQKLDLAAFKKHAKHNLNVGHKFLLNLKEERVKLEFVFSFSDELKQELIFFQIDFHFQIDHLQNYYSLNDENQPVFNKNLISTLISISFSTSRGIIFEKLSNAGVSNVILPIVSPQDMLNKPTTDQ